MPMEWHPEPLCRRLQTVLPTGYNRINLQAELTFTLIFMGIISRISNSFWNVDVKQEGDGKLCKACRKWGKHCSVSGAILMG